MPFDTKCLDLAKNWLYDYPALRVRAEELAQVIQDAIEEWIGGERSLEEAKRFMARLGDAKTND